MQIRLRQLARRYYTGELTKVEYRRARRTVLIAALEGREIEEEITLPIQKNLESHTDKEPTDTQPNIKKQPKNTQQALASSPTGETISPQQKKRPILAYWLVAMVIAVAAYWVFMQAEQDNNIVRTPPLSESDKAIATVGQVPKSEEQVLAENLIYADEWAEPEVNVMIEKLSREDFSAKPWYQQLKDEVQIRQELLVLEKGLAANPQYMAAFNKLASALGHDVSSDTLPNDSNPSPVKQQMVETQTENMLPEDEAIIFPRLDEKPKVKPQAINLATATEQQQQKVEKGEPESSTGSISKPKPDNLPWEVDLVVLRNEKKLRQQQQVLSQHGVQAQIAALDDKPEHWRLYVGSYATKDAAQAIAKKIQGLGLGYDMPWVKLRKEIAQ
jgi:hypothetical protein